MTWIDALIIGLLCAFWYVLGYMVGRGMSYVQEKAQTVTKDIKKKLDTTPVGAVKRPSAEQLRTWADPKKAAEEQEMIKSLRQFPELQP